MCACLDRVRAVSTARVSCAGIRARWNCYGYRFEAEGKIVAIGGDKCKDPALTRHRSRKDDAMLDHLAEEIARDFCGHLIVGEDLTEPEV